MDKNRLILLVLWHIGTTNAADIRALNKKKRALLPASIRSRIYDAQLPVALSRLIDTPGPMVELSEMRLR